MFGLNGEQVVARARALAAEHAARRQIPVDREVLYVAAPTLHPDDVRQLVLEAFADAYDPDWEQQL